MKKGIILLILGSWSAFAAAPTNPPVFNNAQRAFLLQSTKLTNPGWENGLAGWTASGGTYQNTTSSGNIYDGAAAGEWDSSSASQTLTSNSLTVTSGGALSGAPVTGFCFIKAATGTATHLLQIYDGSSVLASQTILSNTSAFQMAETGIATAPTSGTISLRVVSVASNEPDIYIDDCWLGDARLFNLSQVSQPQFIGSAFFATTASCSGWSRTNTALGAFSTDTDCPGPTVEFNPGPGVIQTTDADLPQVTVNNLPPGYYEVIFSSPIGASTTSINNLAINDGTTTSGRAHDFNNAAGTTGATVVGYFNYTTSGNRTFALYGSAASGSISIDIAASNAQVRFSIKGYPITSQTAFTPGQTPGIWSGAHADDCSFARTNTAYGDPTADATCTFTQNYNVTMGSVTSALSGSDKLPGVVFTPTHVGFYEICAMVNAGGASAGQDYALQLTDGVITLPPAKGWSQDTNGYRRAIPLCGIFQATSVSAMTVKVQSRASSGAITIATPSSGYGNTVDWTIKDVSKSFPAPLIANSVVSPSSGVLTVAAASIVCSGSSSITRQTGTWITSIGNVSGGTCLVTFTGSPFSGTPYCSYTGDGGAAVLTYTQSPSSSSVTVFAITTGGSGSNSSGQLICVGPK